ncbi:MAG: cobalamin biosynthesis protein CbiA [Thermodesulfobacteriota bacterium]|nr:cobalamin biosynthesis protein CbiA [Thermodesulfobacteriota bacterium]
MSYIDIHGIVIIVGDYGSGKTEIAVNLAFNRKKAGLDVSIADIDLVNPYFRTREVRVPLTRAGINVILPHEKYMTADLPILAPQVAGQINKYRLNESCELTILDAGGDDTGVTVLAALSDHFSGKKISMLQVINPFRPFTENVKGCMKIREDIENSSRLKVTGLVGNANLIDETTLDNIYKGYEMLQELSCESGLLIKFITAKAELFSELDLTRFDCPVLPIQRKLVPPWKRS